MWAKGAIEILCCLIDFLCLRCIDAPEKPARFNSQSESGCKREHKFTMRGGLIRDTLKKDTVKRKGKKNFQNWLVIMWLLLPFLSRHKFNDKKKSEAIQDSFVLFYSFILQVSPSPTFFKNIWIKGFFFFLLIRFLTLSVVHPHLLQTSSISHCICKADLTKGGRQMADCAVLTGSMRAFTVPDSFIMELKLIIWQCSQKPFIFHSF